MKRVRLFIDFFIDSSLIVALAIFFLVAITFLEYFASVNYQYSICVFFGSIVVYNCCKYYHLFRSKHIISRKLKGTLIVSGAAFIAFLMLYCQLSNSMKAQLFCCGLSVLLYPTLRGNAWTKISFVAFCIAFVTVTIPVFSLAISTPMLFLASIQRFAYVFIAIIPFDIIDSKTDAVTLNTIVQRYGLQFSKAVAYFFLIVFISCETFKSDPSVLTFIIAGGLFFFVYFSTVNQSKYYTLLWLESIPFLWWLLVLFFG